jgi:HlyD family secretion protein
MASRFGKVSRKAIGLGLALAMAAMVAGGSATGLAWWREAPSSTDGLDWVVVRRDDLDTSLVAGGDLEATQQTIVACQVEELADTDGTIILTLIDNGTVVKKGDVLCRLDSSQFEELARQQEILTNQERALCLQAQLVLETARLALREYQEGLVTQLTQEFEGRIALGRSDAQRQADRLAWAESMSVKGYLSEGQLLTERQNLARFQHELRKSEGEFQVFRRYTVPKEIQGFKAEVETAENNYRVEAERLKVEEDELAYIRKQIANCIMRAPKDGVVVHANKNRWWAPPLQPGTTVYLDEAIFMLPDLTRMVVAVSVHESMGPQIRVGMKADVRIASLSDRVIPGHVASIDYFPTMNWKEWSGDVKHFVARVQLDPTPPRVLPFMSAWVKFDTGRVRDALVIPVEAMSVVGHQQFCYVVADDGLERRAITTRRSSRDLVEVTAGLDEGDRVVLRSADVRGIPIDDTPRDPASNADREQTASPSRSVSPERSRARAS